MTVIDKPLSRRALMKGAGMTAAAAGAATLIPQGVFAQSGTTKLNMQLGWLGGGNQIGEVVAKHLGYFQEEKIDFAIQPGGPSIDGVAIVASGRFEMGQVSSSPSLMLAASQGIPVQCFATSLQEHPYCFFSLAKNPIRTPQDMIGKKIGIQATGKILLSALLKKANIPEDKVQVVVIGADMTPVLTGQVDCVTGWLTNTTALKPLGPDFVAMRLWDQGVQLYANPYYATQDIIQKKPELLAGFLRAAGRGWQYVKENPEKSVDLLLKEFPNLNRADEIEAAHVILKFVFNERTKEAGWGAIDPAVFAGQIKTYDDLKQFSAAPPKVEAVCTTAILDKTKDKRPKIG